MARNERKTVPQSSGQAVFVCASPEAHKVFLAGTFNAWDHPDSTPMERQDNGKWRTTLELAPGLYEYKFVVDGEWWWVPASEGIEMPVCCVPNPYELRDLG